MYIEGTKVGRAMTDMSLIPIIYRSFAIHAACFNDMNPEDLMYLPNNFLPGED